ncbi:hypothetical protein, partial [Rhodococcus koreensis]
MLSPEDVVIPVLPMRDRAIVNVVGYAIVELERNYQVNATALGLEPPREVAADEIERFRRDGWVKLDQL